MSFFILKRGCVSPSFGPLAVVTTERDVYKNKLHPMFSVYIKKNISVIHDEIRITFTNVKLDYIATITLEGYRSELMELMRFDGCQIVCNLTRLY